MSRFPFALLTFLKTQEQQAHNRPLGNLRLLPGTFRKITPNQLYPIDSNRIDVELHKKRAQMVQPSVTIVTILTIDILQAFCYNWCEAIS